MYLVDLYILHLFQFVDFLRVQLISLALGVFVTLAFEEPFNSIQKMLVPQTKAGYIQTKNKWNVYIRNKFVT